MNPITSVIKMHTRNRLSWFFIPWIVLLSSFVINLLVGLLLGGKTTFYSGGLFSIHVFMFVSGIITLNDTFPFALGFSMRRTDYLLGTAAMVVALSAVAACCLLIFSIVEHQVIVGWGLGVHFFYLPYFNDGSLLEQLWVYFAPLVQLYALGFAIGSIYRRFGKIGMWVFFILAFVVVSGSIFVAAYFNIWNVLFGWMGQYSAFEWATWLLLLLAGCALFSYLLLRKATT